MDQLPQVAESDDSESENQLEQEIREAVRKETRFKPAPDNNTR